MKRDHTTMASQAAAGRRLSSDPATLRPLFSISVLVAIALATLALLATLARADQMTVFSCHEPSGALVGDYGWVQEHSGGAFIETTDACAESGKGALVAELSGRSGGYANFEQASWVFAAPPWATIAKYTLQVPDSYAIPWDGSGGVGQAYINASDEADPYYDYRNLGSGSYGPETIERTPPDAVTAVTAAASCDSGCPQVALTAQIEVSQSTFVLNDTTYPTVKSLTGSLLSGGLLSGPVEVGFTAEDAGPGVYGAHFVVDGQPQPTVGVNSNNGLCRNLGETSDGTRSFDSPEPCAKSVVGALALETAHWPDGAHRVQLVIEDASGNAVTAYSGTVTFHNSASGLTGAGAPNGTGASDSASLHLTTPSRIHRSYARRALKLRGALVSAQGQPIDGAVLDVLQQTRGSSEMKLIGHAITGKGGAFTAKVPGGPSRTVEIGYRAFAEDTVYAAEAGVSESVAAGVKLEVSPSSTGPTGIITLSGRVLGPIPKHGVLTEVLVYYRGGWEPIRDPRTNARGRFRVVYRFDGAVGRFPFKVEVPEDQAGFAFGRGASAAVVVASG